MPLPEQGQDICSFYAPGYPSTDITNYARRMGRAKERDILKKTNKKGRIPLRHCAKTQETQVLFTTLQFAQ